MAETSSTPDSRSEPAPLFRFGLRELLALVTLCSFAFGLMAWAELPPVLNVLLLVAGVLPLGLLLWRRRFVAAGCFCFFVLVVALLWPVRTDIGWTPSRRSQCGNNLKQIALALLLYHDDYGSFPPAYVADEPGRPMHSWRVFLLPYLEQQEMYAQYRFDEPWNSPHNAKLTAGRMPSCFRCPSNPTADHTNYVAVVGPGTACPGAKGAKLADFADGAASTILLVEVSHSGIHWLEPRDLNLSQMAPAINAPRGQGPGSKHEGGINVVFADGHTAFLPDSLAREKLRALLTIDGGETVVIDP